MQRYQKDLLSKNKNFAIQYVERQYTEETMYCGHCHGHFEIYVQTGGRRCYFLKNSVYEIETGDVVIIAPGLVHKTSNLDKTDYSRLLIEFDEKFLRDMDAFLGGADLKKHLEYIYTNGYFIYRNSSHTEHILETGKQIVQTNESESQFEKAKCRLIVAEFLLEILSESFSAGNATEIGNRYKISEILAYISENYNRNISLKEISEKFYLSYYYLSRLFKEVTGFTFVAYVNIVRANKAKILIDKTDENMETIAELVGFGSQKQFVRVFKALYGISPSKYKSMVKRKKEA